jgi:hypothetical protein
MEEWIAVKQFADALRVRAKRDECGDLIIPGGVGHIYDQSDGQHFGVLLMLQTKQQWTWAKKKFLAAGFVIQQDGDTEGTALFAPADRKQARLALKLARVRQRRTLSPERRKALAGQLALARMAQNTSKMALEPFVAGHG